MGISITCSCGKSFQVKNESAGRRVNCPGCGAGLVIKAPIEPPSEIIEDRSENQGHRIRFLWLGVGVFCAAVIAGAIVVDGQMKAKWANEAVESKVQEAQQAADQMQWDRSLVLLREAFAIEGATKLDNVHKLIARIPRRNCP